MALFYDSDVLHRVQQMELDILKDFIAVCDEHRLRYFGFAGTGIGALRHKGFIPWDDDIDIALPRKDFEKALHLMLERYPDKYYVLNAETDSNYPLMTTRLCIKGTRFQEKVLKDVDCPFGIFLDLYPYDNLADGTWAYNWQVWTAWFWSKILILRSIPHPYLGFGGWKAKAAQAICAGVYKVLVTCKVSPQWIYKQCLRQCKRYNHKKTKRMGFPCDTDPNWNTLEKATTYPLRRYAFEDVKLYFPSNIHDMLVGFYGDYMVLPPVEKQKTHYPEILDFGDGVNVVEEK